MTLKRMDNVLIVVDDLEAVKAFFTELGLKLEGETTVEGPSVGSLIGLEDVRATAPRVPRTGRRPQLLHYELARFDFTPLDEKATSLREVLVTNGWSELRV